MADRYQDRPFPSPDDFRGGNQATPKSESDPLAELARLIGQTDPFAGLGGRANQPVQPRGNARDQFQQPQSQPRIQPQPRLQPQPPPAEEMDDAPAPPSWMQRAAAQQQAPPQDFDAARRPAQRYVAARAIEPDEQQAPSFAAEPEEQREPSFEAAPDHDQHQHAADQGRYDEALYGQLPDGPRDLSQDAGYDDAYGYQDDYDEETVDQSPKPRRGGMFTVAVVLALAVVGTGAAFAYRTYLGSERSGEPPIIRADTGPNKMILPAQSGDSSGKLIQDRMTGGTEKLVSREEQPIDLRDGKSSGPRVVFPPLSQNANPPPAASVAPLNRPLANSGNTNNGGNAGNGSLAGDEPRKIRTVPVRGDQADAAAVPAAKPTPATRSVAPATAGTIRTPPPAAANANASANAPLSIAPPAAAPAADAHTRVASTNSAPQPIAPVAATSGGGYMVQVSSQGNEAAAQASFKSLQGKYPDQLGSRDPLIKQADVGGKTVYRAMVGPFASSGEANQFCGSLKTAGGQCFVPRN
jgi:sporulation related protein